jgi:hypothetical protein
MQLYKTYITANRLCAMTFVEDRLADLFPKIVHGKAINPGY